MNVLQCYAQLSNPQRRSELDSSRRFQNSSIIPGAQSPQELLAVLTFWTGFYQMYGMSMPKTPQQPVFMRFKRSQLQPGGWTGTVTVSCDIYHSIYFYHRRVEHVTLAVTILPDCTSEYRLTYLNVGGQALGHLRGDIVVTAIIEEDLATQEHPAASSSAADMEIEEKQEREELQHSTQEERKHQP
jgi:hypothetical protein